MADTDKHAPAKRQPDKYEREDARVSAVLIVGLFILALAVLTAAASWVYFRAGMNRMEMSDKPISPLVAGKDMARPKPPEPTLQLAPPADMEKFLKEENERLSKSGWDKSKGVVRIPIARAMDLILERGLPTRADATTATDHADGLPQDSSGGTTMEHVK